MVDRQWWQSRWFLALLLLATAAPLLWPPVAPFPDLPGHIGRYRVELDLGASPTLQQYFEFHWSLIGNLGIDLLVIPLAPLFGLELAVKLLTIGTAVATTAAMLWVSKEIHGRIPPTALFAIPFVFSFPFNYGFINFSLSIALALLAFALWLRLASRPALRGSLFVPLAIVVWVAHAFGWGVLGLLVWSSELVVERDKDRSWIKAALAAALRCVPLSAPIVPMLLWRSASVDGVTAAFFGFDLKIFAFASALRDRWLIWDALSVGVAVVLIGSAVLDNHLSVSRRLGIPAIVLGFLFILLPRLLFGSNYADMRLPPLMLVLALLALKPRNDVNPLALRRIAWLGLAFVAVRLGGNAISFAIAGEEAKQQLSALDKLPYGAPVLSLVGDTCGRDWAMPRHIHLGSYVITRNYGFSNDQWELAGAQLISIRYTRAGEFMADPSEFTVSPQCRAKVLAGFKSETTGIKEYAERTHRTTDLVLRQFPRDAFDYVWLIRSEGFNAPPPTDLRLIWDGPHSRLFQVVHTSEPATRQTSSAPMTPTNPSDT